ncbi:hypothetical protein [Metabacillus fastidiosus]|uniref:hypothetical protein n=1 Tax=Metabacillus fastidiosus TaxID=1458 RepID=UPI003D26699C
MAKYKVLKAFIDKNTKKEYGIDSDYSTTSEKRANELIEMGFLEALKPEPKTAENKPKGEKDESGQAE